VFLVQKRGFCPVISGSEVDNLTNAVFRPVQKL